MGWIGYLELPNILFEARSRPTDKVFSISKTMNSLWCLLLLLVTYVASDTAYVEDDYDGDGGYEGSADGEDVSTGVGGGWGGRRLRQFNGIRPYKITQYVNSERARHHLPKVKYNHTFANALSKWAGERDDDWFYQRSNYSRVVEMVNRNQADRGMHLLELPEWQWARDQGWEYMFRDTTHRWVDTIFRYRNNQRGCFDVRKCNATAFKDYWSCLKTLPKIPIDSKSYEKTKCPWAAYYYYKYVNRGLLQYSCVFHNYRTPYVPAGMNQPYSFHCYGRYKPGSLDSDRAY